MNVPRSATNATISCAVIIGGDIGCMKKVRKCPKCGSTDIIADARVVDHGGDDTARTLTIEVRDAHMVKRTVPVSAYFCELCGYMEFYAAPQGEKPGMR